MHSFNIATDLYMNKPSVEICFSFLHCILHCYLENAGHVILYYLHDVRVTQGICFQIRFRIVMSDKEHNKDEGSKRNYQYR